MEDIVLVTGCDLTKSWINVAFLGNQDDARVSFRVEVNDHDASIKLRYLPKHVHGAALNKGPEGKDLPEDQTMFIRGFRVARSTLGILPKHLKAAAGPSPDSEGYDHELDSVPISMPAVTTQRDPLHLAKDYIAEQASDCDMVLIHDDDLGTIVGIENSVSRHLISDYIKFMLAVTGNRSIRRHGVSPEFRHRNT